MNVLLLVALLIGFWGLSLYWQRHPDHPLLLIVLPVVGFFFVLDAVLHPERRYLSLMFAFLAAAGTWRAVRARKVRA